MKILIVSATRPEIAPIYQQFNLPDSDFVSTPEFDILITGVGMTATAFALGYHLSSKYSLILNLGIAGSFDKSVELGSVLNIVSDELAELGAQDHHQFISIESLGFGKSKFSAHHNLLNDNLTALPKVKGITVNTVHGNEESIAEIAGRLQPVTESMEGAAVFYAAEQLALPCLQVRSISNYVESRNKDAWKIGLAIKNLNEWALRFLTNT